MGAPHTNTESLPMRDHVVALLWLMVFCGGLLFSLYQIKTHKPFHSNLLELLPRDERKPVIHDLSVTMASRFEDKLLVLINASDQSLAVTQARDLQERLLASPLLVADDSASALPQALIRQYRPYSQQLLTPERRHWLETLSPAELAEHRYRELFSPLGMPYPFGFAEDPFNLGGYWMTGLAAQIAVEEYQGFPIIEPDGAIEPAGNAGNHQPWLLVTARLTASPFNLEIQAAVRDALAGFREAWPQAHILTSGMVFHATEGTRLAKQEINTVGLGSGLGIVLLVVLVFRSAVPLLAVMLTMTSAYIAALAISLSVFERIHLITLAFGSTLLGVAGDYVLHFLMGSQRAGSGSRARHELRYAMAIGALTGMGAYLLQSTTPFPGLQQMAVFCAAGIAGAWLTVLALAPYYRVRQESVSAPLVAAAAAFRLAEFVYRPLWQRPYWVSIGLGLLALLAIASIVRGGVNDAVTNLNTSPVALMESEQQVQAILRQPSFSRFLVIEGESIEQLLTRSQLVEAELARMAHGVDGLPLRSSALQQYVPSVAQQEQDRQLVATKLYGAEGALGLLCQKLGITPCPAPTLADDALTPEVIDPAITKFLPPVLRSRGDVAESGNEKEREEEHDNEYEEEHKTRHESQPWYSPVTFSGGGSDSEFARVAASVPGVTFVNQTKDLSSLLGRYRTSVSQVLLMTLVLLAAGLAMRYRQRGWRMLLPLALAMLLALGGAALEGITLFHTMALLLVIGIGLDTAVFYTEGGFNAETWLASSLACLTSILAFGLLSLSVVPILHQFGVIILTGILGAWLLTPLFFRPHLVAGNSAASIGVHLKDGNLL